MPEGHSTVHVARKPFEYNGKQLRYVALICPDCAHAYEMRDFAFTSYAQVRNASSGRGPRPQQGNASRSRTASPASQSRPSYEPTHEQQAVIEVARAGKHLVVQAGAGAGKTSTLELVGHALAGKKVAYTAYNRVTKDEASRRFPSHVRCATAHGLAHRFLQRYRHRLDNTQRQRAEDQARILGIQPGRRRCEPSNSGATMVLNSSL